MTDDSRPMRTQAKRAGRWPAAVFVLPNAARAACRDSDRRRLRLPPPRRHRGRLD